jgi:hypothetical protein
LRCAVRHTKSERGGRQLSDEVHRGSVHSSTCGRESRDELVSPLTTKSSEPTISLYCISNLETSSARLISIANLSSSSSLLSTDRVDFKLAVKRDLFPPNAGDDVPDGAGDADADLATSLHPLRIGVEGPAEDGRLEFVDSSLGRVGGEADERATGHKLSLMSGMGSLGMEIDEPYVGPRRGDSWILVLLLWDEYECGSYADREGDECWDAGRQV